MMRSLYSGVSGLQNHQTRMDVIGNNVANVNTTGFKKGRVDFNGNTGPFIQYTHARICSVLRKAAEQGIAVKTEFAVTECNDKEKELIKMISRYGSIIELAAKDHAPSYIANYAYDLVKLYNQFYHDYSILNEESQAIKEFRLALSKEVATIVASGMGLLGIRVPERM